MRTTLYDDVSAQRKQAAFAASALEPVENAGAGKRARSKRLVPVEALHLQPYNPGRGHPLYEQVVLMAACN